MRRFWAKFYLWLHGYCTKHGTPKTLSWDMEDGTYFCQECETERSERIDSRVSDALKTLGHEPD